MEDLSEIAAEGGFEKVLNSSFEQETGPGLIENQQENTLKTPVDRKLIWTGDLRFQVKDVDESTNKITQLSEKYGGFIADMQMTSNPSHISNQITIRIGNDKFQSLIQSIKGESLFLDRANISSDDVTEEYVDIESRLKTKREVRERYIEILRKSTGDISDVLEAEEAIRKITEEIEAKEGRLRYLKDRIAFSTITVDIYQKVDFQAAPTIYEKPYSEEMGESFSSGWGAIKSLLLGLILIWPIVLVLLILGIWKRKQIRALFASKK